MSGTAKSQYDGYGNPYFVIEEGNYRHVHYVNEFCRDIFSDDEVAYKPLSNTSSMGITVDADSEEVTYEYFQA